LVDDNESFLELFLSLDEAAAFDITALPSAEKALDTLERQSMDLVICDVQMPHMNGIELFHRVQDRFSDVPVILITAFGSTEQAIQAVKEGAFHYFEKPLHDKMDLFWATVREALAKRQILKEISTLLRERSMRTGTPPTIIAQSKGMKKLLGTVRDVAPLPVTTLITGETGTGKELVARAIHQMGDRKDHPFVAVNCTEFAAGILESELFGHEKGSFTGAVDRKIGLFDVAHKGILFLDEIGEASPAFQAKLLRVLETKTFMRVGGTTPIYSDFRLIAATNRNLQEEVSTGGFRQDLFYRLNVCTIEIPPLRDRREDIPPIADFYLKRFCNTYGKPIEGFSTNAALWLRQYDWPGNVRELINVVERGVITCRGNRITTRHLPFNMEGAGPLSDLNLKDVERYVISMAMKRAHNNKTKAAELLGISRKTLIEKVKAYGIT